MATKKKKKQRHYCRSCGAKRFENVMQIVGRGAFGKNSWECKDGCGDSRFHEMEGREKNNMIFKLRYNG